MNKYIYICIVFCLILTLLRCDDPPSPTNPNALDPTLSFVVKDGKPMPIVSLEPLESGLPEYWKVGIAKGMNTATVLVSKSISKDKLAPGMKITVTRYLIGYDLAFLSINLLVGLPVESSETPIN